MENGGELFRVIMNFGSTGCHDIIFSETYDLANFWDLAIVALATGFLILALGSSKSGRIGQF